MAAEFREARYKGDIASMRGPRWVKGRGKHGSVDIDVDVIGARWLSVSRLPRSTVHKRPDESALS